MKNNKCLWKNEKGSVAVIVACCLTMLLGFLGLAMDVGNLVLTKTKMQNAVDAAACAGALAFSASTVPPSAADKTAAKNQANTILQSNGFPSVTLTIDASNPIVIPPPPNTLNFPTNATWNGSSVPAIYLTLNRTVPTYVMGVLGIGSVSLSAKAEAVQTGGPGPFGYALFSDTTLPLTGNTTVHGSVHSNGSVTMTGNVDVDVPGVVSGNVEGATGISATGNITVDGALSADSLAHISTTGNVSYGSENANATNIPIDPFGFSSQLNTIFPSMTTYTGNQTFNGNIPDLTNSIYVDGNVTFNGNINSTGAIVATGNITINGNITLGSSNQICLYSTGTNKAISLTGNVNYGSNSSAVIFNPKGSISITGNSTFNGSIVGKSLTVTGNATYNAVSSITALPLGKHAKLIK